MKKIRILIIILLAIALLSGVTGYIFGSIKKNKVEVKTNMNIILDNYKDLQSNVSKYNEIREKYSKLAENFYLKTYKNKHSEYLELFSEYDDIVKDIDKNIENIGAKCDRLYKDLEVNKVCDNYEKTYDKLIDIYVEDVDGHNERIKEYNEYAKDNLELISKLHEGRDSSEG